MIDFIKPTGIQLPYTANKSHNITLPTPSHESNSKTFHFTPNCGFASLRKGSIDIDLHYRTFKEN